METLANGAYVIDQAEGKNGRFILAKFCGEFVTWVTDGKGNVFSGNYFVDILDAAKNFKKRLNG